jgi:HD superfamily phosphohydrolase
MPKQQRIRDPLHDLIEFNIERSQLEHVLWRIVQTRPFQRLRRIKQLGFSDFVYPGATHSRLLHSAGVFHTARRLMKVIEKYLPAKDARVDQALAAALVHDLGHGPFSHAFEKIGERFKLKMANHEAVSDMLIRDSEVSRELREMGSGFANDVADMVSGGGAPTIYSAVVSSQFDADRLDYMRRDRLMTGTQHAGIDYEWLIENLEVGEVDNNVDETRLKPVQTFVLGRKAIFAAEAYVLGLFQLYPTIYFHKTTRGAEKIYTELLSRIITLIKDGSIERTGLPNTHPLVKFAQTPDNIECALALDDTVIWGGLSLMAESGDEWISKFAERLRDRKLYKCIDTRAEIAHDKGDGAAATDEADTVCAGIRDEIANCLEEWSTMSPASPPRILIDEVERSPYKKMTEGAKGPLNQINIRTEGDHLVDLSKRSNVVAELKTYKAFRVYHAEDDEEAKRKITEIVEAGIAKWPA